jgi:predicted O-methyltransferase YrrM
MIKNQVLSRISFFRGINPLVRAEQDQYFKSFRLDREKALLKINEVCLETFSRPYSEVNGMWSEHLVFFSALSQSDFSIKSILEIGTFKAETTLLLSRLFPNSKIVSIDLSKDNLMNSNYYNYFFSDIEKAIDVRDKSVKSSRNIEFLELNSLGLIHWEDEFDLIWVDGDHRSPISILDIYNSLRLVSENGIVVCDDVYKKINHSDKYSDDSSYLTIKSLVNAGLVEAKFIRKRISRIYNLRGNTKFLGVFQKITRA